MPLFHDWARAMREMRYLNAIAMYGPRVGTIARRLGVRDVTYRSWLVHATYRWPIYEDDTGGVYIGGGPGRNRGCARGW
jgi:hypothetical protein